MLGLALPARDRVTIMPALRPRRWRWCCILTRSTAARCTTRLCMPCTNVLCVVDSPPCGSISGASGAVKAASTEVKANFPTPLRRSIGCRPTIRMPDHVGSRASRSAPGLILQGDQDALVPVEAVQKLVTKLSHQRDIKIDFRKVPGADHYFADRVDALITHVDGYIGDHLGVSNKMRTASQGRGTR